MRFLPLLPLALLLACGGATAPSGSSPSTVEADVEAAVRKHLSRRSDLDMTKMDMSVDQVDVQGDEADATVGFKVKGAPASAMSMSYHLVKEGGEWVVQATPAGHGAAPPPAAPGQSLPPGHPPAGGSQPPQQLPPNHPPVAQ
jgi:hypothetical protein